MVLQGGGAKLILTIFMLGSKTKVKQLPKLRAEEEGVECPKEELFFFWEIFPTAASKSLIFSPFPPHVQLQLAQWSVQPWPWRPAAEGAERE